MHKITNEKSEGKQFNFGVNWDNFSKSVLTSNKIEQAKDSFGIFFQDSEIKDKTFIDIGFGQGLNLLIATDLGAKTVGNDINPICKKVLELNKIKFFPEISNIQIPVIVGSILADETLGSLKKINNQYEIVHSWGVLHHTGNMWKAIDISSSLVCENGKYIIAIYNKHWSSRLWWVIKKTYNFSPTIIKKLMIVLFYIVILVAKFMVTLKNPLMKERGMNFYYDVVDWIGGYPYEYATKEEIQSYIENLGFRLLHFKKAQVPTGCHEYVFIKKDA